MPKTTYLKDAQLNTMRDTTLTAPTDMYLSLLMAVAGLDAGSVTEASFSGYARQVVNFGAPAAGGGGRRVTNSGAVTFPAKGDAGSVSVIAYGVHDAVSAGNLWRIIYNDGAEPILFVADAGDVTANTFTSPAHGMANDQRVRLVAVPGGATLPTGVSEDTTYWVVGTATDTFQLSLTQGGAAIDITAVGRGMLVRLTPITVAQNDQVNVAIGQLAITED